MTHKMEVTSQKRYTQDEHVQDEELDPRIQAELEKLNQTSTEINRLENELDEARTKHKMTFAEASNKMTQLGRKIRKQINQARHYYELKECAKEAQGESLKAARQYQSAISVYRAAKETVTLAEERLLQKGEVQLSSAWQEMMNHSTMKVMEAEAEKRRSEVKHQQMANVCGELEQSLRFLEKKHSRSIARSRPYFELRQQLEIRLQQLKQNVLDLQTAIKASKSKYSASLRELEHISEDIHENRRVNLLLMLPREPGVGEESSDFSPSTLETNLDQFEASSTDQQYSCPEEEESDLTEEFLKQPHDGEFLKQSHEGEFPKKSHEETGTTHDYSTQSNIQKLKDLDPCETEKIKTLSENIESVNKHGETDSHRCVEKYTPGTCYENNLTECVKS